MLRYSVLSTFVIGLSSVFSCSPKPDVMVNDINIAIYIPPKDALSRPHQMGGVEGRFVIENDCLLFEGTREYKLIPNPIISSVVFPEGTQLVANGTNLKVIHSPSGSKAQIGELISGGGGFSTTVGPPIEAAIPAGCRREGVLVINKWFKWDEKQ